MASTGKAEQGHSYGNARFPHPHLDYLVDSRHLAQSRSHGNIVRIGAHKTASATPFGFSLLAPAVQVADHAADGVVPEACPGYGTNL